MKLSIEIHIIPDASHVAVFVKDAEDDVRWEWYSNTLQGGLDAIPIIIDLAIEELMREFEIAFSENFGAVV